VKEIFRCLAGSRLFGTATPSSDTDYKAVHLPDARSILLGTADAVITHSTGSATSKNTAADEDYVSFPLREYLGKLAKMETNSVEMLFAVSFNDSDIWDDLYQNRYRLLSANKKAFTGFGKAQAMRYAVRGERLTSLQSLLGTLRVFAKHGPMCETSVLTDVENALIPGVTVVEKPQPGGKLIKFISAFGREVASTCTFAEAIRIFEKPLAEMGKRTEAAAANGGADWKGLYHAHRIVDEGLELFQTGYIEFPCPRAAYYLKIRNGELGLDEVLDTFEERLAMLEAAEPCDALAPEADHAWIDAFVVEAYNEVVCGAN
jgi:hypothetical protein